MSAFRTLLIDPILDWIWPMNVCLPEQTGIVDRLRRGWALNESRHTYKFNYSHVSPLAIADTVPIQDDVSLNWLLAVMERVLVVLENRAQLDIGSAAAQIHRDKIARFRALAPLGTSAVPYIREMVDQALRFEVRLGSSASHAQTLHDYSNLFRSIGLPPVAKDFQQDSVFAELRLSGPNPVMLRRLTELDERLPITDPLFQVGAPGDSLSAALAEARLYIADYSLLQSAKSGSYPHGQKHLSAPLVLFVVDHISRRLMPVAIQCNQIPGLLNPIFTPRDGWNWMIAKTFVEIADGNIHEAYTHLVKTHLSIEPFVVSTLRQLSIFHPLSRLLRPHFEGTLRINELCWKHLLADHGAIEQLFSASIPSARGLAAKGVETIDVMNSQLPATFAQRGVDDPDALPGYSYRDDSLLYWNAIRNWVNSYIGLYYASDAQAQHDHELQAWCRELASANGGKISGLPNGGSIQTVNELLQVLTFVIFTCTVQHAAVNFPQYDFMAYAPNMPLASYSPAPTLTTGATESDFLAVLPTLDMAELQMEMEYLLGGTHFTQLGNYASHQFSFDPRVAPLQQKFQAEISAAGQTIAERNRQRTRPYKTLDPAGIPQSINI